MSVYVTRVRKSAVAAALGVGLGLSLVALGPTPAGAQAQDCEDPGHAGVGVDCVTTTTVDPGPPRDPGRPTATPQPVDPGQTPLAVTGGDLTGLAALGAGVIVAGGALVRRTRRGRRNPTSGTN